MRKNEGRRKLEKHQYGRIPKRKKALEVFQEYDVLQAPTSDPSQQHRGLMTGFMKIKEVDHDPGIIQELDSSTTSASENGVPHPSTTAITLTPDERVQQLLQTMVTPVFLQYQMVVTENWLGIRRVKPDGRRTRLRASLITIQRDAGLGL
ncbi:hypothetical protein GWK47_006963 [Chionoecetes opilio]|uniref:Uncharacterized protein n=1 Tax=Chionoecetes opilio TaxID=41210 RepID=A0A8J4YC44_CHIOP|nr:hypothetical protein GWK47_006963 [Chionoecetes opilio]